MARVFLSYDRDDAAKARTLAETLEAAGHSVWWDSHIKGGTEYSKEIEQALSDAEAVVVLWSRYAINSPWVRDEAAAGRDRGKLVPIRLDEAEAPMGFRQYQNIDLSKWKGRGTPSGVQEIIACIDRLSSEQPETPIKAPSPVRRQPGWARQTWFATIGALVLAAIGIAYLLVNRGGSGSAPVVAVVAADNNAATRSLADDLFIKLGSLQTTNADALQLVEQSSDADPDLSFRVSQRTVDRQALAIVALLAGNGDLMWSREFAQEKGPEADLRQQIAYSAALVLKCATEAMAPGHARLKQATLKLYLNGCARYAGEAIEEPQAFLEIFTKVTEDAPDFEAGWAKLLIAETEVFLTSNYDPTLRKGLTKHIAQARKLNPHMAEAYDAEAWMMPIWNINGWMPLSEAAVAKNPSNVIALTEHSNDMFQVGRLQKSITFARRSVQADPLSPWVRNSLIVALAHAGEVEAANDALEEAERLWPGASNFVRARFWLASRYGDPREALALLKSGKVPGPTISPAMESFLEARIDPTPSKVERAIAEARTVGRIKRWLQSYIDALVEFRRKDELIEALIGYDPGAYLGPAEVFEPRFGFLHDDVRFMAIMKKWGSQLDYWKKSGNWPDFCSRPSLPYDCKVEAAKVSS